MPLINYYLKGKKIIDEQYQPDGYNIGINCGEALGKLIFHVHVHLIPRFKGDMEDPRGGVRGVIPEKQNILVTGRWFLRFQTQEPSP